jgi:hypothetical protein
MTSRVYPDVPVRQFVTTVPFPMRFPLAFDGKLLGQVLRIFIDTVAANYRKRLADRSIPSGKHGAVAGIQRASSDLRCITQDTTCPRCKSPLRLIALIRACLKS